MAIFTKSLNLGVTDEAMVSHDYRQRFAAEYIQTKVRYERLKAFCDKIEAAFVVSSSGSLKKIEEPKHDCPIHILRDQQRVMGEYLHILELRAIIEDVDLEEAVSTMLGEATCSERCRNDGK